MAKIRQPYHMPRRAEAILIALSRALIAEPEDLRVRDRDAELIRRSDLLVAEMPKLIRIGFLLTLYFFDRMTLFFGFGILPFVMLKPESRERYVDRWLTTKNTLFSDLFKSLRGIVMITYFSHPDVWRYVGYEPQAHLQERLELRRRILARESGGQA